METENKLYKAGMPETKETYEAPILVIVEVKNEGRVKMDSSDSLGEGPTDSPTA